MNSFSAKVLEYIYRNYKTKFPIHGQGIYKCKRSCDSSEINETELFDWCCLYPNEPGHNPVEFKENFEKAEKNIMKEPPRNPKEPLFDKTLFVLIAFLGVIPISEIIKLKIISQRHHSQKSSLNLQN